MRYIQTKLNSNGLTLIELLASITLLSIVILTFLSFFSQSIMLSGKVEDKLVAINLAEKVLVSVKEEKELFNGLYENEAFEYELDEITQNGKLYCPKITSFPLNEHSENEVHLGLRQISISIFPSSEQCNYTTPLAEVYSYIKIGGD
ncbi:type IV pilus modification PilV family protein [Halalkalibacter okhensis]|uniref:Prepilin-type N-terminal cleavage/methylation domain-containing protein n=1 Tax=Halalkalibacter okhensis TaxID=333138 RepID=A0A0B0IEG2_9BACI|nr:prepilin-type N-terminal cleavage/methylation domain-containing protein [Halalkalibacter okhensis]KHF40958.1 hypothetical protein LQ50_06100 [Halalkalibacter okhensis]